MASINFIEKSPKLEEESIKITEKPMDFEAENNINIIIDDRIASTSMETTENSKNSYYYVFFFFGIFKFVIEINRPKSIEN